ncbi:MAG: hypothetical protein QQN62_06220 [Nitrosopumilus sp.]|nr:hypothetical protein [Nitrososphaerota archaeon]
MVDHIHAWRKKLRLKELMDITKQELESGKEITIINEILDIQMQKRWNLVSSTRKQYLDDIKKILANQYVLVI